MLQLHLSDQQFYCLLRCGLYYRFDISYFIASWSAHHSITTKLEFSSRCSNLLRLLMYSWIKYGNHEININALTLKNANHCGEHIGRNMSIHVISYQAVIPFCHIIALCIDWVGEQPLHFVPTPSIRSAFKIWYTVNIIHYQPTPRNIMLCR